MYVFNHTRVLKKLRYLALACAAVAKPYAGSCGFCYCVLPSSRWKAVRPFDDTESSGHVIHTVHIIHISIFCIFCEGSYTTRVWVTASPKKRQFSSVGVRRIIAVEKRRDLEDGEEGVREPAAGRVQIEDDGGGT